MSIPALDAYYLARVLSASEAEGEAASGILPPPDCKVGKILLWQPSTIREWVARGGVR